MLLSKKKNRIIKPFLASLGIYLTLERMVGFRLTSLKDLVSIFTRMRSNNVNEIVSSGEKCGEKMSWEKYLVRKMVVGGAVLSSR